MSSEHQNTQWVRRGLWIGVLAAGAACSGQSGPAPSSVPTESTAVSSPVTTTTEVERHTVPAPLAEEDEERVRVRFVAYGDVDPNDDIPSGLIPDVRIAVIYEKELQDWWDTIGGGDLGHLKYLPPGAQIQSSEADITSSQVDFAITGYDGTTEIYAEQSGVFSVCVVSPIGDLIAGCSPTDWMGRLPEDIFYIYFSHGRAYFDRGRDGSERYHRFLYGKQNSYSSSGESATITFVPTGYTGHANKDSDYGFIGRHLTTATIAIIDDIDIGDWWIAVSDNGALVDSGIYPLGAYPTEFGWNIYYDTAAQERVDESVPVRYVHIDRPRIAKMDLAPGNYLFCDITEGIISSCDYEDIAATQNYIFKVDDYQMQKLPDSEGRQLLKDAKNWEIRP